MPVSRQAIQKLQYENTLKINGFLCFCSVDVLGLFFVCSLFWGSSFFYFLSRVKKLFFGIEGEDIFAVGFLAILKVYFA